VGPSFETPIRTGVDPCAGPNPIASEALCLATGVPAGRYGTVPVRPAGGQFFARIGGNLNLEAEESDTWTFGAVWTPEWVDGLTASVDWYSIEISGAIVQLAGGAPNVHACYVTTRDADSVYCRAISRSRLNGALFGAPEAAVLVLSVNTGLLKTTGFDVGIDYHFELGDRGVLRTSLQGA
jgi:outer membrane receptor protein involved in Fe transport